jgi:hypothetical protein
MKLIFFLQLAGLAHLALLCAGASMPAVVQMRGHLKSLPPFLRQLFWTYYSFIGLCLAAFGSFTFFYAEKIAAGDSLARAVCLFLAIFWTIRLLVAAFIFTMRPYLTTPLYRLGYTALNGVFVYLIIVYTNAALFPIK